MKIMAHRGNQALYPENSMAAFRSAIDLGADGIELDVHLTKDGQLVVIHDETLDRTTNGHGAVKEYTLSDIRQWRLMTRDGELTEEVVPTLAEFYELVVEKKYQGLLNIELKTDQEPYPGIEAAVLSLTKQYHLLANCVYSSFNWHSLIRLRQLSSEVRIAALVEAQLLPYMEHLPHLQPEALHVDWKLMTEEFISQYAQYPIRLWTVNEPELWQQWLQQGQSMSVEALMTDTPLAAMEVRSHYEG